MKEVVVDVDFLFREVRKEGKKEGGRESSKSKSKRVRVREEWMDGLMD